MVSIVGSSSGQRDLTFFRIPCRISQCLQNVLAFEVGAIGLHFIDAVPGPNLANHHVDCDAHATDARPRIIPGS